MAEKDGEIGGPMAASRSLKKTRVTQQYI
uniref:Uncharacterized protein n=1 Tax=Arundo donax TaxID=35708 RepID=A0A0A9NJ05_ARUDO